MELVKSLKALADGTRLQLVTLLLQHPYCVGALAGRAGISPAAVSQHLKLLRQAGLVTGQKQGHYMHYGVDRRQLYQLGSRLQALAGAPGEAGRPAGGAGGCPHGGHACCPGHKAGGRAQP